MTAFDLHSTNAMRAGAPNARASARAGPIPPPINLRAQRVVLLLAAMLAFVWQSCVIHGHLHNRHSSALTAGLVAKSATGHSSPDNPDNCPICQEAAQAGHYLLPVPVTLGAVQLAVVWYITTPTLTLKLNHRSHSWHSRAPPKPLQV